MKAKVVTLLCGLAMVVGLSKAYASSTSSGYGSPTVLYSQSSLVEGSAASVTPLDLSGAGQLFLTLTDLNFPEAFSSLDFSLNSSSAKLAALSNPGTLQLAVAGPTTLYADVFSVTQASSGVGLYNLTASFLPATPVPLPAGGLLLFGALLLLPLGRLIQKRALSAAACKAVTPAAI